MGKPYSTDLRERVTGAVIKGEPHRCDAYIVAGSTRTQGGAWLFSKK
jgi:hypothetical protein